MHGLAILTMLLVAGTQVANGLVCPLRLGRMGKQLLGIGIRPNLDPFVHNYEWVNDGQTNGASDATEEGRQMNTASAVSEEGGHEGRGRVRRQISLDEEADGRREELLAFNFEQLQRDGDFYGAMVRSIEAADRTGQRVPWRTRASLPLFKLAQDLFDEHFPHPTTAPRVRQSSGQSVETASERAYWQMNRASPVHREGGHEGRDRVKRQIDPDQESEMAAAIERQLTNDPDGKFHQALDLAIDVALALEDELKEVGAIPYQTEGAIPYQAEGANSKSGGVQRFRRRVPTFAEEEKPEDDDEFDWRKTAGDTSYISAEPVYPWILGPTTEERKKRPGVKKPRVKKPLFMAGDGW